MSVISKRGGKRENAGRPSGQGRYGEPTKSIRIPLSQETTVRSFLEAFEKRKAANKEDFGNVEEILVPCMSNVPVQLPLYATKVAAGLPSPADDYVESTLDISEFMIDRKDSTFFITIKGESMIDVGLMPGDKVVVDRSKRPVIGDIVLAVVDQEFTIKIYDLGANKMPRLVPANSSGIYRPIHIRPNMQFEIFGVVIGSFRRFK